MTEPSGVPLRELLQGLGVGGQDHERVERAEVGLTMHYLSQKGELHTLRLLCSEEPTTTAWLQAPALRSLATQLASNMGEGVEILALLLEERHFQPLDATQCAQPHSASVIPLRASCREIRLDPLTGSD